MKYKNIASAIHNFGDSFVGGLNYVAGKHVYEDLFDLHARGIDIVIDWKRGKISPWWRSSRRIATSVADYRSRLDVHLKSQNVELDRLESVKFFWPAGKRKFMLAVDDRGVEHKIYVSEIK